MSNDIYIFIYTHIYISNTSESLAHSSVNLSCNGYNFVEKNYCKILSTRRHVMSIYIYFFFADLYFFENACI